MRTLACLRLFGLLSVGSALVTGCTWFQTDVQRGYEERGSVAGARIYTTADIRVVSQRVHPVTNQLVTCTEPTPDVAKALSTAAQVSVKGGTANANGKVGLSGGSAEAVAELAGRSTALLALRDGLFRACEAYENGAIGADAYSLVLGRYGQLMTTLFLGEDIQGAARSAASVQSPAVNSPAGGTQNSSKQPAADDTSDTAKKTTPKSNSNSQPDGSGKSAASLQRSSPLGLITDPTGFLHVKAVETSTPAKAAAGKGAAPADQSAKNSKQTTPGTIEKASSDSPSAGDTPNKDTASMSSAAAAVQLNKDFFDLDNTHLVHLLVVACINEYDPTRKRPSTGNSYLQSLCDSIKDVQKVVTLQSNIDPATRPPSTVGTATSAK